LAHFYIYCPGISILGKGVIKEAIMQDYCGQALIFSECNDSGAANVMKFRTPLNINLNMYQKTFFTIYIGFAKFE
jgi:hypothetical protein